MGSRREGSSFLCSSFCFFKYKTFAGCAAFKHAAPIVSTFLTFPQQYSLRWRPGTLHPCLLPIPIYLLSYWISQPNGISLEIGFLVWWEVTASIGFLWEITKPPLGFLRVHFNLTLHQLFIDTLVTSLTLIYLSLQQAQYSGVNYYNVPVRKTKQNDS